MTEVTTIGIDLAKNVFQIHGIDASGETCDPPTAKTPSGSCLLQETATLSRRHRGLRHISSLGARDRGGGA